MKLLKSRRGEIMVTVCVVLMVSMTVIAFGMKLYPVYIRGQQLNTYATELCRVAEISGRIGEETDAEQAKLNRLLNMSPEVSWNTSGNVQLGGTITVTCTMNQDVGLGGFGTHTITIHGHATGQSEVYQK